MIAASYTDEKQTLTQEELQFGPYLLQKKNAAFQAKWRTTHPTDRDHIDLVSQLDRIQAIS